MDSISRYIVRTTLSAFALILGSLIAVVWITHALREIDIITNQSQSVLAFVGITSLLIPSLALVVAPLALIIAVGYTLNRLNADSEIVVMNAAGMSPWRIFMPFLTVGIMVSLLVVAISAYIAPQCLREMRSQLTQVRADLIAHLMQPGRFTSVDRQLLTFYVRERRANGELLGIFIDDRRNPEERGTFIAEQGQVVEDGTRTFLVLVRGSAQRTGANQSDPTVVLFDRYAFDLTPFTGGDSARQYSLSERFLWELIWPGEKDAALKADFGRRWRELNDRLAAPLYPIVFTIIGFALLGAPRTSRQSRGVSIVAAMVLVGAIRLTGFAAVVFATRTPSAAAALYVLLAAVVLLGLTIISRGAIIEPPAALLNLLSGIQERLARGRTQPAAGSVSA